MFWYGVGGDTKLPGKWVEGTVAPQPMTAGIVRLDPNNGVGWYQAFSNPPDVAGRTFQYGLYTDRPIAGDWLTTGNNTHFGPGIVRDESTQQCGGYSHSQGWYLKYNNSTGGGNVYFKFELNRP